MDNVSREKEFIRKNQKDVLEIKNTATNNEKCLWWAYWQTGHSWEKTLWAWGCLKRSLKKQKAKRTKMENKTEKNNQGLWGINRNCNIPVLRIQKERERTEWVFETLMPENFPNWCGTPNPRFRELRETKQINDKNPAHRHIIFKLDKIKDKEKTWKEVEGKDTLPTEKYRWELYPSSPQKSCKQDKVEWNI